MDVRQIPLASLCVAKYNVRKTVFNEDEETGVVDLANDIRENGLINPLTVRRIHHVATSEMKDDDAYEIVAGQRRFLALQALKAENAPCNIIDVDEQKAEELSLIENVQRNQMTMFDKVRAYSKLMVVYGDLDKVSSVVSVSKATIAKYVRVSSLDDKVLARMDCKGSDRVPLDVLVECTKLLASNPGTDIQQCLDVLHTLTTPQKLSVIRLYARENENDMEKLLAIRDDIALAANAIKLVDADKPFVFDSNGCAVYIPPELYETVVDIVRSSKKRVN
jgi:ParB/RepB/Spo0J family partition protein